jgi:hypothetical protein
LAKIKGIDSADITFLLVVILQLSKISISIGPSSTPDAAAP